MLWFTTEMSGFGMGTGEAELFRQHLNRVLASAEFANSRQAREFLLYAATAAFEGRDHLEQCEIAEKVLNRGGDFNPLDDASVRKVATLTRQKLEKYQASEGRVDLVSITLPLRSYVPVFRLNSPAADGSGVDTDSASPPITAEREAERPARSILHPWILYLLLIAVGAAVAILVQSLLNAQKTDAFEFKTRRGDIMHESNDVAGDGIRLGPKVSEVDDVDVQMLFSPEMASQQAGIMIFENADRYVKLGRQFGSRDEWEFGLETHGRYQKPAGTFVYDPTGQDGAPVWISIRRNRKIFEAFLSSDGLNWRKIGNTLEMPDPMPNARVALYAYNGRTNASSTVAKFNHLRIGPLFHDLAANPDGAFMEGWTPTSTCGSELGSAQPASDGLNFLFRSSLRKRCDWMLTRQVPPGNWALQTRMDFQAHNGTVAGLIVSGSNGYLRLIRWEINNGSITAEHFGHNQVSRPDFPGSPPVTLRIQCKSGVLRSSFSRDDSHFVEVEAPVHLSDLGSGLRFGIHAGFSSWIGIEPLPPVHFQYVQREILALSNYR